MLYQNQKDETLVLLTLAGEQRAYEALVVRYQKAVIAAAASVTHNTFMAEDAAQDAFVTAWMKLNTLQEPQKFGAWVCRIAKNCALNMVTRFRSFLPMDVVENLNITDEQNQNPAELYALSEERNEVNKSMKRLPEKVRQIIHLHYFEGLSIAEIADRMRLSEGTVKWQLHDGRKRIRKELCAMNEKWNDTLVQRVMKKVEELKLWQLKNSKNGFEAVYRDVLREVEELPECKDKHHALADVLMRGWWWLPGKKNDALFARIREAAELGKNDEVMEFIVAKEDEKLSGKAKIEWIRDKQIPRLEQAGFVRSLAYEWFWLGCALMREKETEAGFAAYEKVLSLLEPSEVYYALASAAIQLEKLLTGEHFQDKNKKTYRLHASAIQLCKTETGLCFYKQPYYLQGSLWSVDAKADDIFRNAAYCDGQFTLDGLSLGDTHTGSDGTTLTLISTTETVTTPCGSFENCQLWQVKHKDTIYKTYYKDGVGIVKQEKQCHDIREIRLLKDYHLTGGSGLIPYAKGNTWAYDGRYREDCLKHNSRITVCYADGDTVILSQNVEFERLRYDENSWQDMVRQIRTEYWQQVGKYWQVCDVSHAIERAEALAATPLERAHTKAAASVARRIMETNQEFNPNATATGHWNFFNREAVSFKNGRPYLEDDRVFDFELKRMGGMGDADTPLLYNNVYEILQDVTDCLWSEEWIAGTEPAVEFLLWDSYTIKTKISCSTCEPVTTKAGTFQNCIRLALEIEGFEKEYGLSYIAGNKVYYFAEGVGIVRTENEYCDGTKTAVYELTSYEGKGEGYMPFADGMVRRYDALGLTDGFVGSAEYTYVADEDGQIIIFSDRTGIRNFPPPITQYSAIEREMIEERLWNEKKLKESRARHDINNFHIILHFLGRDNRTWKAPQKAVAWCKYRIRFMEEMLTENGELPRAWLGWYADLHFIAGCASFGCKNEEQKEEGYAYLEKAFALYPRWLAIPDGDLLEVGNETIYGEIKLIKGKSFIVLPDETKESISDGWFFSFDSGRMYYGMTAPKGWEWFNSVRNEERFKEYVARAKKLMEDTP